MHFLYSTATALLLASTVSQARLVPEPVYHNQGHKFAERQSISSPSATSATRTGAVVPTVPAAASSLVPTSLVTSATNTAAVGGAAGAAGAAGSQATDTFQAIVPPPAQTGTVGLAITLPVIPIESITSSAPAHPTMTLPLIAPGSTPSALPGNPVMPMIIKPILQNYPTPDKIAPTNSPLVKSWINAIDWTKVPNIPVTNPGGCANNSAAVANAGSSGTCWWTCGSCSRNSDISTCPTKMDFGLSFDDGPSVYTPAIINYLESKNLTATFFVIGSRAVYQPEMVQYEYFHGHQICAHTWAHSPLTTLSNDEIVAELGWSMQIIGDLIGVVPTCMRPPFGDIDDRVRAIATQMNLQPLQWTAAAVSGQANFDTNDWKISSGTDGASGVKSQAIFANILDIGKALDTGFIALEHDLYQQSVELAYGYLLPAAIAAGYKLKSIVGCQGSKLESSYAPYNKDGPSFSNTATNTTSSDDAIPKNGAASSLGAMTITAFLPLLFI